MRNSLLFGLVFMLGIIVFPGIAKAQYNPYIYSGNSYLNYALASQRARRMRKGRKTTSRRRKYVHRKRRKVSMIENLIKPKTLVLDLPERTVIV